MRKEAAAGIILFAASLGMECNDGSSKTHQPLINESSPVPSLITPTHFERPTATPSPTPMSERNLPVYFSPTRITLDTVPSFARGISIVPAEKDANGDWKDPGLTNLVKSDRFPNQTIIWGHSRWQGVYQDSGDFMMEANVGDVITLDGANDSEKFTGISGEDKKPINAVKYEIKKFMVIDERDLNQLYNEDQKFESDTIIYFTSLRVNAAYDPRQYWVIPKEKFFPKAEGNILRDLEDPQYYGYAVAILQIKDRAEECKIITTYEDVATPPGFKTPRKECS